MSGTSRSQSLLLLMFHMSIFPRPGIGIREDEAINQYVPYWLSAASVNVLQ
jgi:hypothetical protein